MSADEVLDLMELLRGQRPAWVSEAACNGMGADFHALDHRGQQEVCLGCPVRNECLVDLFERAIKYGHREINDGNTVCGGVHPRNQRRLFDKYRAAKNQ